MARSIQNIFLLIVLLSGLAHPSAAEIKWSVFSPLGSEAPPQVEDQDWSAAIDAFVYKRLIDSGLTPAAAVDRRVWIRRATYDLIGLPPSPAEVQAIINDSRSDAEALGAVVDRLLQSPRYGERWGRHWLDVVRYADTDGFAIDGERLSLWRYRDYVIRALNEDRPFDQFIREQIAGDELKLGVEGKLAISFYRLGPWEADNMTPEHRRQDYLNDVTANVGSAFLGMTIGCARCHDHKFDPITQADFYQLQAFFTPIRHATIKADYLPGEMSPELQRRYDQAVDRRQHNIKELRNQLRKKVAAAKKVSLAEISESQLDAAIKDKMDSITKADADKLKALTTGADALRPEQRFEAKAVAIRNPSKKEKTPQTFILNSGDVFNPGEKVVPGFLSEAPVWSNELVKQATASGARPGGRRKILALWLTSPHNPVTPRVLANRIWNYHFGIGIVATPNDLGTNGAGPSHPQLLDYLARRVIETGWRLKPLHREILLSRTYRTSSRHPQVNKCAEIDPNNRLLWRLTPRRLESETVRDAVLAVSGRLRFEMSGPGFYEELPAGMGSNYPFFKWNPSSEEQRRRRSVYMFQRRNLVHPMMESFDGADLNQSCERRSPSVTAPQALSLFNSKFTHDNSLHLAKRVSLLSDAENQQIEHLFWFALSRSPSEVEQKECLLFLQAQHQSYTGQKKSPKNEQDEDSTLLALRDLALAIINTNEFLYLD